MVILGKRTHFPLLKLAISASKTFLPRFNTINHVPFLNPPLQVFSSSLLMKTSCLRLKLVELNFLVSFNTDDQSQTDVANTANIITYNDLVGAILILSPIITVKLHQGTS